VDWPAKQPCRRHNDREASQDETTEIADLLLSNALGQQPLQFARLDLRRMDL
jgi:hypothetical protein